MATTLNTKQLKQLCEAVIKDVGNDGDLPISKDQGWANLTHTSLPELIEFLEPLKHLKVH